MKSKIVTAVILGNLGLLLALVFINPDLMIQPGKLINAHEELSGDCFACHTPFIGSTAGQCIECHKVVEIGLKTTKGLAISKEKKNVAFHQSLMEEDCVACHSDHKGVQSFRPIGQFSHQLVEQSIREKCDSCHINPGDALHQKVKGNCASCHTQERWVPATFDHDDYFRFDREHTTECETCHVDNDYNQFTCYGCHEHSRSNVREEHVEEGIYEYENCAECHRSGDDDEAERLWNTRSFRTKWLEGKSQKPPRWEKRKHHDDDD
ncbi:MAG: cytochrome c3 family protein [Sedimenticola sp.]